MFCRVTLYSLFALIVSLVYSFTVLIKLIFRETSRKDIHGLTLRYDKGEQGQLGADVLALMKDT